MVIYWGYIKCYTFVKVWKFFVKEIWVEIGESWKNFEKLEIVGGNWRELAVGPNGFLNGFVNGSGSKERWGKEKQWMEAWER